jgi:hypothetical protein
LIEAKNLNASIKEWPKSDAGFVGIDLLMAHQIERYMESPTI